LPTLVTIKARNLTKISFYKDLSHFFKKILAGLLSLK
jgi:hypothetical protein